MCSDIQPDVFATESPTASPFLVSSLGTPAPVGISPVTPAPTIDPDNSGDGVGGEPVDVEGGGGGEAEGVTDDCGCLEDVTETEVEVLAVRGKDLVCDLTCSDGTDLIWGEFLYFFLFCGVIRFLGSRDATVHTGGGVSRRRSSNNISCRNTETRVVRRKIVCATGGDAPTRYTACVCGELVLEDVVYYCMSGGCSLEGPNLSENTASEGKTFTVARANRTALIEEKSLGIRVRSRLFTYRLRSRVRGPGT